jgi:hypothetical protein
VRFEVIAAVMKVVVFWYVTLCSLVGIINFFEEPAASVFKVENLEFQIGRWKVPPKFMYQAVRCYTAI